MEFVDSLLRKKPAGDGEVAEDEASSIIDVVFLSPPWGKSGFPLRSVCNSDWPLCLLTGGTEYLTATNEATDYPAKPDCSFALPNHLPPFPLETLTPLPAKELYDLSRKLTPDIAFFLPRNSDPNELSSWADEVEIDTGGDKDSAGKYKAFVEVEEEWMGWTDYPGGSRRKSAGNKGVKIRPDQGKLKAVTAYYGQLAGNGEVAEEV